MADTVEFRGIATSFYASILTTDEVLLTIENASGSGRVVRVYSIVEGQQDQSQLFQRRVVAKRHAVVASGGTIVAKTKLGPVAGAGSSHANVVIRQGRSSTAGPQTVITPGDAGNAVWQSIIHRWAAASQAMWINDESAGPRDVSIELAEGEALSFTQINVNAIPASAANTNARANLQLLWEEVTLDAGPPPTTPLQPRRTLMGVGY